MQAQATPVDEERDAGEGQVDPRYADSHKVKEQFTVAGKRSMSAAVRPYKLLVLLKLLILAKLLVLFKLLVLQALVFLKLLVRPLHMVIQDTARYLDTLKDGLTAGIRFQQGVVRDLTRATGPF
ncbi:hypothetical protein BGZ70_002592 [Mortierella alpina]|uniref:Uncharacterized protein n=1 Tax=Mortierella alpina TaxID=64518 RepID=A0A9P6IUE5_MORAP|nr:hypothetical protein BGZ70_002592 [Mortierella alpina]